MAAVAAVEGKDLLFEFNPSAPEFVPLQPTPELTPQSPPLLDSGSGSSRSGKGLREPRRGSGKARERQESPSAIARAISCSPQLLACQEQGYLSQRRAAQAASGRRLCESVPASPALTSTQSGSSSSVAGRQQGRRVPLGEEVATLVIKNLALDFRKEDVESYLASHGVGHAEVELHLDPASQAFRGTVFVRYPSPGKAREALCKLGPAPEIGGRKARVEIQKSKNLFGRKSPGGELPPELALVQQAIERFIRDSETEVSLPATFDAHQRKYAHSFAERHNLTHATRQNEAGATYVYLSKNRMSQPSGSRKKAASFSGWSPSTMSPPGLPLPGLELTPMLSPELMAATAAEMQAAAEFMLPVAAMPPLSMDLAAAGGALGLLPPPAPWPSSMLSNLVMLHAAAAAGAAAGAASGAAPLPPPGLEPSGLEQALHPLLEQETFMDNKFLDSTASTEDNGSKSSSEEADES
eukprot:TRINITY_DN17094_c0_g1_i1.p1 TRINITY_DN17094_c0_g1~~TRINITY_DN17094_c0_g1_i1.p1  ORF type:complete len:468 (-),score=105.20 TRINITY_DN17094_c0_g1_i1:30-1433(-)